MKTAQSPKYVLKGNETAYVPKQNASFLAKARTVVWCVIAVLFVASFIFRDNLFSQMTVTARICLIGLFIGTLFVKKEEKAPSPFELWFFDDCLVIYKNRKYHSKRVIRREYDRFYYRDIKECVYHSSQKKICIYGVVEGTYYNYRPDGTLPDVPDYHKTTDSMSFFYTEFSPYIDFAAEIESHSPIKVQIK